MCVLLAWRQIIYLFLAWILEVDLLRSLVPPSFVSLECDSPCNNKSVMRSSCNNKVVVLHTTGRACLLNKYFVYAQLTGECVMLFGRLAKSSAEFLAVGNGNDYCQDKILQKNRIIINKKIVV